MDIDIDMDLGSQPPLAEANTSVADLLMEVDSLMPKSRTILPLLTKSQKHQIQHDISATTRPTWQAHLPDNFGDASHGKLKADQWRTSIEFDLPVSLARFWSQQEFSEDGGTSNHLELLDNTMHLAAAVFWATSRHTSPRHVERYMEHMIAYIRGILHLFPQHNLRPHHHNALHLGELLLRFGPVHGWWTFPFERLIGKLQKINSNSKPGKMLLNQLLYCESDIF